MQLIVYWSGLLPSHIVSNCRKLLADITGTSQHTLWIVVDEWRTPLYLRPQVIEFCGDRNQASLRWWRPQNGGSHFTAKTTCLSIKRQNSKAILLLPQSNQFDWEKEDPNKRLYFKPMLTENHAKILPWLEFFEKSSHSLYLALDFSEVISQAADTESITNPRLYL